MDLDWNGTAVKAKAKAAAMRGMAATMSAAVDRAKTEHTWLSETGRLEESIMIFSPPKPIAGAVTGSWGAKAPYALYLEIGTSRPWSGAPRAETRAEMAAGNMWMIMHPQPPGPHTGTMRGEHGLLIRGGGPLMEPRMYLRPAAEFEYSLLADRIYLAFEGLPI